MQLIKLRVKNSRKDRLDSLYLSEDGHMEGYVGDEAGKFNCIIFEDSKKLISLCRNNQCELIFTPMNRVGNFYIPINLKIETKTNKSIQFEYDQSQFLNARIDTSNTVNLYNFLLPYTEGLSNFSSEKKFKSDDRYIQMMEPYKNLF